MKKAESQWFRVPEALMVYNSILHFPQNPGHDRITKTFHKGDNRTIFLAFQGAY